MIYDLRIYKSWGSRNPKAAWVNNYQLNYTGEITDAGLTNKVNDIIAAEKMLHSAGVQFLNATLSSMRDEVVYDPKMLKTWGLTGVGSRPLDEDNPALDLNIAMRVRKGVNYGRIGSCYYRGCLFASDVVINDRGESQIAAGAHWVNPVIWANFNQRMNAITDIPIVMADKINNDPEAPINEARIVQDWSLYGVVFLKRDHRYFDRAPKAPPVEA